MKLLAGPSIAIACCFTGGGCIALTPYATILETVPRHEFVKVGEQWVHFERKGSGDSLILIHGFAGSTFSYRQVMDGLAKSFDVIAVDLNGFGYTERPFGAEPYSPRGQVALVTGLMDRLGVREAHVLGHSYGAGIAMLLAVQERNRVTSVIAVDGAGPRTGGSSGIPRELLPLASALIQTFVVSEDTVRRGLTSSVYRPQVVTDEFVSAYYSRIRIEGLGRAIEGLLGGSAGDPLDFAYRDVRQPALIIWGEHDNIIPISVGENLHKQLTGSQFVRFDQSGHLPMDEEPQKFVSTVTGFLNR
ncbi:MAG: alpha/beta hydrolase [Phycisphaerae bacterium]|nr:alpha/beta hydrolase [Phycisphaerae bacterium]